MRQSRGQIIDQALQRVGNTTASLVAQARIRLNRILQDLHQQWDWPHLWTTVPIEITPGGFCALPLDFLKPEDRESLLITSVGGDAAGRVVLEVDHKTFWQRSGASVQTSASIPVLWTIEYARTFNVPSGRFWPRPQDSCTGILRCKLLPPDYPVTPESAYDNDIPPFPFDNLISDLLFEWAQSYEIDPRRGDQYQVNIQTVERVRGATFPDQSFPSQIP